MTQGWINERDSGRYDAITDTWIDSNVKVDFAWGNIPMQPDDDRNWAELPTLDPALDSHIIATSGYEGFPAFTPGGPFDDTVPNVEVPNLVGLADPTAALDALVDVGLVLGDTNSSTTGANSGNDMNVKSQNPTAGTLVNVGSTVDIVVYDNPAVNVPSVVDFDSVSAAEAYLISEGLVLGTVTTSSVGATSQNNNWVKSQTPAAGTSVAPGTAVNLVRYVYTAPSTTGPIAGFNRTGAGTSFSLNGNQSIMYLLGQTVKPTAGDTISVSGSSDSSHNVTWVVDVVENNNSYNTGGTAVKVTLVSGTISSATSTGGTWAKV